MRFLSPSLSWSLIASGIIAFAGCDGSSSTADFAQYKIVAAKGGALQASVGDAYRLSVVEGLSDGTTKALSTDATVVWSGPPVVTALPVGSAPADSILPQPGLTATAMWIQNPEHLTPAQVAGVLYVLDAGSGANPSISVTATVTGGTAPAGQATSSVPVGAFPLGNAARGQPLYSANCAVCHGAAGEGEVITRQHPGASYWTTSRAHGTPFSPPRLFAGMPRLSAAASSSSIHWPRHEKMVSSAVCNTNQSSLLADKTNLALAKAVETKYLSDRAAGLNHRD